MLAEESKKGNSLKSTVVGAGGQKRCCCQCCQSLKDRIPARVVLYFLSWSGFLVSFMMRSDMNFALVAMTHPEDDRPNTTSIKFPNGEITFRNVYDWSSGVQSVILSSFYWSYVLSQVIGGLATQHLGTKFVFGLAQLTTAVCSLCIPWAAELHYGCIIALRSVQGFASGLTFPAMYAIVGPWIPLKERSRFMSSFQGFNIGIGLTYSISGLIIQNFGWRYVFLATGSTGMIWCVVWFFLAFNTPRQHPRITTKELQYIEENTTENKFAKNVPWIAIFTSLPVWSLAVTMFGRIWITYIFVVAGPNFMRSILEFEYLTNGFFSGTPFICSYFSSLVFCFIADKMILRFSLTFVRKFFTIISQIVPSVLLLIIAYVDNVAVLLALWYFAIMCITAAYAGAMANIIDLAPNFSGPVLAFSQAIHMSASFLSPLVVGLIVTRSSSIEQWRNVFIEAAIVASVTYLLYQFCGTAEVQKWNVGQSTKNGSK